MHIFEFFDLSENFYRSGRVTVSTLRIRVCPSVARKNELQLKKLQVDFPDLYMFELSRM